MDVVANNLLLQYLILFKMHSELHPLLSQHQEDF